MRDRLWDVAAQEFSALVKRFPGSSHFADSVYYLGFCRFQASEFGSAARQFRTYLQRWPAGKFSSSACYYLGRSLLNLRRAQEAAVWLDKAVSTGFEPRVAATFWLGRAWLDAGDWAKAARALSIVIGSPNSSYAEPALYELGRAYVAGGRFEDAVKTLRALLTTTKDEALTCKTLTLLASSLLELGRFDEVSSAARRALGVCRQPGPLRMQASRLLAESLIAQGRCGDALPVIRDLLNQDGAAKGRRWAAARLFDCLLATGRFSQAEALLLRSRSLFGGSQLGNLVLALADRYSKKSRPDDALRVLNSAARLKLPATWQLAIQLKAADLLFKAGRFDAVVSRLSPLLLSKPPSEEDKLVAAGLLLLGRSLQKLGNSKEASRAYQLVLKTEAGPETVRDAAFHLVSIWSSVGRFDEALTTLEKVGGRFGFTSQWVEAATTLIAALNRKGLSKRATDAAFKVSAWLGRESQGGKAPTGLCDQLIDALSRKGVCSVLSSLASRFALNNDLSKEAETLLDAGECFFHVGRLASASTIFKRFLHRFPEHQHAYIARARLGAIRMASANYNQASQLFLSAARTAPGSAACQILYLAGEALMNQGKLTHALEQFEAVVANPDCPGPIKQLCLLKGGMVCEQLGMIEMARVAYQACASLDFVPSASAIARGRLERLVR